MSPNEKQLVLCCFGSVLLIGCPKSGRDAVDASVGVDAATAVCAPGVGFDVVPYQADFASVDPLTLSHGVVQCQAPVFARITRISDGDTIHASYVAQTDGGTSMVEEQVRLIGINCPEIAHPPAREQCFGNEASRFSEQLIGRDVWLTFDRDCRDNFGRLLAYVHTSSAAGGFYNRQLMRRGFANVLSVAPNTSFQAVFTQDQVDATCSRQGLHASCTNARDAGRD